MTLMWSPHNISQGVSEQNYCLTAQNVSCFHVLSVIQSAVTVKQNLARGRDGYLKCRQVVEVTREKLCEGRR
jgi:hypothetical protein